MNSKCDDLIRAYPHIKDGLMSQPANFTPKDLENIYYKK
jgi:hypothetical protein